MFKKLILVAFVALVFAATACSESPQESPSAMAQGNPVISQEKANKVLSVSELTKQALNNEYKNGDIVFVSGTILKIEEQFGQMRQGRYKSMTLGTDMGFVAIFESESILRGAESEPGYPSYSSIAKRQPGEEVVVRATYKYASVPNELMFLSDATIVQ